MSVGRGLVREVVAAVAALVVCVVVLLGVYVAGHLLLGGARAERAEASASAAGVQVGAPYPADTDHLEEVLAVAEVGGLPEGAQVVSVEPAVNFADDIPGGWGYVIAFTAGEQAIRDYVDTETGLSGDIIENHPVVDWTPGPAELADLDLASISRPWQTGVGGATTWLVLERPLGRGWLVTCGGGM
ncbi:hypothetical protein [Actinomyces wuliandei]|uniref:hypothetical protein n=1 Tax=Actinomyces wuliandei TaxID=2057743 RepID=UPI00214BFC5F|nr:hypothetical protein [Actinomyces wuliandei]